MAAPNVNDYASFMRYVYKEKTSRKYYNGMSMKLLMDVYNLFLENGLDESDIKDVFAQKVESAEYIRHFGEPLNDSTIYSSMEVRVKSLLEERLKRNVI